MIELSFEQRESIGFQHVLAALAPCSAYGAALLRRLRPFAPGEEAALRAELDNVARAAGARARCEAVWSRLEALMAQVRDLTRSIEKCGGPALDEVELFELRRFLLQLGEMGPLVARLTAEAGLRGLPWAETRPALELLDPEKTRLAGFHISARHSAALAAVRREKREVEGELRRAGEAGAEALQARRRALVEAEEREEDAVRARLTEELGPYRAALHTCAATIGRLDLTLQKAKLALRYGCCKPEIDGRRAEFEDMFNPLVADRLALEGKGFTPVSIALGPGVTVITGANMGGKSVTLKAVALNVLAVSCGLFAFARSARVGLFKSLHLISEDMENGGRGLSSFGGEIVALGRALAAAERGPALLLLDEFAWGTNPHEGAAIARAVAGYLSGGQAVCAMTTHYDGVAQAANAHYQVAGLRGVDWAALRHEMAGPRGPEDVARVARHMDYRLFEVKGPTLLPRDALNICRLLGLSPQIIAAAEAGLSREPGGMGREGYEPEHPAL